MELSLRYPIASSQETVCHSTDFFSTKPDDVGGASAFTATGATSSAAMSTAASPATARTSLPAPSSRRSTPTTGGGKLSANGVVPLKLSLANPALSGGDPLAAGALGQLAVNRRPLPAGSLPDIGAVEADQPLSTGATANNDVHYRQLGRQQRSPDSAATTCSRASAATIRSTLVPAATCSTAAVATTVSTAPPAWTLRASPSARWP